MRSRTINYWFRFILLFETLIMCKISHTSSIPSEATGATSNMKSTRVLSDRRCGFWCSYWCNQVVPFRTCFVNDRPLSGTTIPSYLKPFVHLVCVPERRNTSSAAIQQSFRNFNSFFFNLESRLFLMTFTKPVKDSYTWNLEDPYITMSSA